MFTVLLVVLGVLLTLTLLRRLTRPGEKEPPFVSSGLPVVGPVLEFSASPRDLLQRLEQQYGQAFTLDMLVTKMTFVLGREGNRLFFDATDDVLDFNSAVAAVAQNVLGPEAFTSDPEWANTKSSHYITKGFMRHERLALYSVIILDETAKHIKLWLAEEKVDLYRAVSQLVTSINIRCVLGDDAYNDYASEISAIYYQLEVSAVDTVSVLFPSLPTTTKRNNDRARARLLEIISRVLHNRPPDVETSDYIGMIWRTERDNHDISVFTMHALAIMFAAHTNTAGTTAWTLAEWADNKAIAEKARCELEREAGGDEKEAVVAALRQPGLIGRLEYMDACMKETVRRYGMLMLVRKAVRDVPFTTSNGSEFIIPKGRTVACSPFLSHHDTAVYPEPNRYDPERFADPERRQSLVTNRHYVQFGFGRHKCLGERFANAVIKTVLALVLHQCEFELVGPKSGPDYRKATGTPGPEHPIYVKFRVR